MYFLKKIVIIAIICTALYFMLGYHYIVVDKSLKMLKKSELTMRYTFISTKGRDLENILTVKELWDDGLGDLLLERGKITEQQWEKYKKKVEEKDEESE